ncbi:MAG: hypothetical protein K0Q59_400 [Paenibacillus sp.]|nr:hypothetical protein [Paenibacillus sp.]
MYTAFTNTGAPPKVLGIVYEAKSSLLGDLIRMLLLTNGNGR